MNSTDYQYLVDRLEKEIQRNKEMIKYGDCKGIEWMKKTAKEYIDYHTEMIKLIKRIDKERR